MKDIDKSQYYVSEITESTFTLLGLSGMHVISRKALQGVGYEMKPNADWADHKEYEFYITIHLIGHTVAVLVYSEHVDDPNDSKTKAEVRDIRDDIMNSVDAIKELLTGVNSNKGEEEEIGITIS